MDRLSVLVDSMNVSTIAAALLKLSAERELHITVQGTLQECIAREREIALLLAPRKATFMFAIGFDKATLAREADFCMYAVKVTDFGGRRN